MCAWVFSPHYTTLTYVSWVLAGWDGVLEVVDQTIVV